MEGCHGKQKVNSHNTGKNGLKKFIVVCIFYILNLYFIIYASLDIYNLW